MERKYFFFDIDGTLLVRKPNQEYIPDSTMEALRLLEANGHFVAIATGRSYAMAESVLKQFNLSNMVSDGGNGITINNRLLGIEPLDYQKCLNLIDECIAKDFIWAFSPDNATRRLAPDDRFYNRTKDSYMKTVTEPNLDPKNYPEIYKVYIACEQGEEQQLDALKELPWCRFHKEYLFVEPCDKSNGIKKIMKEFNADIKDVVVFGDEKNDLSMFLDDWFCIAMGNAVDELKEKANYITDDVDQDGIWKACKHFGWI